MPEKATTKINVKNLEKEFNNNRFRMTKTEIRRAEKVIVDLKMGADAYQKEPPYLQCQCTTQKVPTKMGEC